MEERWRPVPSEPLLEASTLGRVRSRPYVQQARADGSGGRVREASATFGTKSGKRMVWLFRRKNYKVHRLVCEAFHGPPPPGQVCMHLDECGTNNVPSNLAWGTQRENLNAPGFLAYCRSRTGEDNPLTKGRKRARI